jgi:argininosuccinate lyase
LEEIYIMSKQSNSMWGGRFDGSVNAVMEKINASIPFDKRLWQQDIKASKAHAAMLGKQNILSQDDVNAIHQGLDAIAEEIIQGKFEFSIALEDIHMNIEANLKNRIGDAASRLHTARSRNDQVVTDFRLWVRDACDDIIIQIETLQKIFLQKAEENIETIMPGFTHLQVAQPITLGHHLMAYVQMFERDKTRFIDARKRMNECPLGAAALAGTGFNLDRFFTAKELGFDKPTENSLDSVSSRDFALEFLASASICATHLSRIAEEIVLWITSQFAFIELSSQWTTGSSIMPQKKNPDAAELIRAKIARILGSFTTLTVVMKGLPLAYSKDMQEDKEPVFDTAETLSLCLAAMTGMIEDIRINKENMYHAAKSGFSTATDIADWLVREINIPFRDAHHITGSIVKIAEETSRELHQISLNEMQNIHSAINQNIYSVLSVENSVASRKSYGGTAPESVKTQIKNMKEKLCV